MTIPFLRYFKKASPERPRTYGLTLPLPVPKRDGDRLSKTVMPNSIRKVSVEETNGEPVMVHAPLTEPGRISLRPNKEAATRKSLPPAVAVALAPRVERAVSFDANFIIKHLPPGLTRSLESVDGTQRILLRAQELEQAMAVGKPAVSLGSIRSQAPGIFLPNAAIEEERLIDLPFDAVLEAFMQMQVRRDQLPDQTVAQIETPFLKVTLEDNERFGLPSEPPLVLPEMPPIRVELATAATLSAAQSEAAADFKPTSVPLKLSLDAPTPISLRENSEDEEKKANAFYRAAPESIAFHFPSKETGEPASERVPASCGPPVSTQRSAPPPPVHFSFSAEDPNQAEDLETGEDSAPPRKISLSLKPILENLPVFQLGGDPKEVPEDVRIELPFELIEPGLLRGRVAVEPELFERVLPAECRHFFNGSDSKTPVVLPLHEVVKNLPSDSLRRRENQEQHENIAVIETPFSTVAAEDAQRFQAEMPALPEDAEAADHLEEAEAETKVPANDAKTIITEATQLPGVKACCVSFADGLSLAGNLPADIAADGLCAIAPTLLQRIDAHLLNTNIGDLNAMTLHCARSTVTFFRHENICLAALHANGELTGDVHRCLTEMAERLSRTYSQPEASHVHH